MAGFFFNILFANLNPFAWYKFQQQVETQFIVGLCLLPIVALGAGKAIRGGLGAPFLYMACAGARIPGNVRQDRLSQQLSHRVSTSR